MKAVYFSTVLNLTLTYEHCKKLKSFVSSELKKKKRPLTGSETARNAIQFKSKLLLKVFLERRHSNHTYAKCLKFSPKAFGKAFLLLLPIFHILCYALIWFYFAFST